MAWTAPMTATANVVWSTANFNTHIRDNLNETGPAKATAGARYMVATGTNAIAERVPSTVLVATSETRTSTSYGALTTAGPAITATTGTRALVMVQCQIQNSGANHTFMSHAISGATTLASSDTYAFRVDSTEVNTGFAFQLHTALTAGSNTFTSQYRVTAGTGTFANRRITVLPF